MREALYWLAIVARTETDLADSAVTLKAEGAELVAIVMKSAATAQDKSKSRTETGYPTRQPAINGEYKLKTANS